MERRFYEDDEEEEIENEEFRPGGWEKTRLGLGVWFAVALLGGLAWMASLTW
jgi:hypothetical protein